MAGPEEEGGVDNREKDSYPVITSSRGKSSVVVVVIVVLFVGWVWFKNAAEVGWNEFELRCFS